MSPEKETYLVERYPELYRPLYAQDVEAHRQDPRVQWMVEQGSPGWGEAFTCGDGWFDIIERLSERLAQIIRAQPAGEPWRNAVAQVKEKIGTLKFYLHGAADEMRTAISAAEEESGRTCELCGAPGTCDLATWQRHQWVSTRCERCPRGRRPARPRR